MIEILFLGTSSGLPSINRSFPSLAIKELRGGEVILFDAGENTQRQIIKYKIGLGKIKHIFISHNHIDHFLGLYGLIETYKVYKVPIPKIHLPERIPYISTEFEFDYIRTVKTIDEKFYSIKPYRVKHIKNSYGFLYSTKPILKYKEEEIRNLTARDFINLKTKGYTMKGERIINLEEITYYQEGIKVFYTGDTLPLQDLEELNNVDILIHDGTFINEKEEAKAKKHSTILDAISTAKKLGAKLLLITHLSNKYDEFNRDYIKELLSEHISGFELIIANDGLRLQIRKENNNIIFKEVKI